MRQESFTFESNFNERNDLEKYGSNNLLLYALQIRYGIEDIDEVASTCLLDGYDDKKIDLLYINTESGEATIAQGYKSSKRKDSAPANKASDLNTAVTWLLTREIGDLPVKLQSAAVELRQKINDNEISKITLWYSHNLPESENVRQELLSAEKTLSSILESHYKEINVEACSIEVGEETLEDWYKSLTVPILVSDTVVLEGCSGFSSSQSNWESFTTAFPAVILYDLYHKHEEKLFSANVRDYLGSRRTDSNINNGIKLTANEHPDDFFVFNNGITALVNSFSYDNEKNELTINGMSVVNGAQTTGAVCSLGERPSSDLMIPIRFIKCDSPETITSIVKFNNSQNKINAPDFRSNDIYQRRITNEFLAMGKLEYSSRRGGAVDIIRRNPDLLPSITAGQVLAAFHGEPSVAYNDKSKIWESDALYSKFFNDHTTAKHIFLCYSLLKSIEDMKLGLSNSTEELLVSQEKLLSFLRSRGSIVLLLTAVADSFEDILNKKTSNLFALRFCNDISLGEAKEEWSKILNIVSPFTDSLNEGLQDGIKNKEMIDGARKTFKQLVSAVRGANSEMMDEFSSKICVD